MSVPVISFFNNKGGVGKTSLVYHLSWMCSDLGLRVLAADLDPQANLSAAFLDEERLEELWPDEGNRRTVYGAIQPLLRGVGDIAPAQLERIEHGLALIVGDLALSGFEDELSAQWPQCLDGKERGFRVLSAFWRIMQDAAASEEAQAVLVDLGPNLGAINRAALIASDYVVIPLTPDLYSLQGLRNLGPRLRAWRQEWRQRLGRNPAPDLCLPGGDMRPLGYIVLQHSVRLDRPVKAYDRWIAQIPQEYRTAVLGDPDAAGVAPEQDKHCLALLKHYRSLMPMAQEARKPMFHLKPADGAIGSHLYAAESCRKDFRQLAGRILDKAGVSLPAPPPDPWP